MKRRAKILITLGVSCLILETLFGVRDSQVSHFPIPIIAHVYKVNSNGAVFYNYIGADEFYMEEVRFFGWKKKDQFGSMWIYEKGNQTVAVVNIKDGFVVEKR